MRAAAIALTLASLLAFPAMSNARGPSSQEWADSLHVTTVNGAQLSYLDVGRGDPIVFVHGSLTDYRVWLEEVQALSAHYRVIAYSRRYHFPNTGGGNGGDYSVGLHQKDLAGLMDALDLPNAYLVGHSYGGLIAASFAVKYPDRVRSLVLIEPTMPEIAAGMEGDSACAVERHMLTELTRMALQNGFPELGVEHELDWAFGDGWRESLPRSVKRWVVDNSPALQLQFLAPADPSRFGPKELQKIACPILYVEGGKSPAHAKVTADAFVSRAPATRRVTLKGASHGMPWTDARRLTREMQAFFDRSRLAAQ